MWLTKLFSLMVPVISLGFRLNTLNFSTNYFKGRNINYVCLLSCEDQAWDVQFAKTIAKHFIAVSSVNINTSGISYKSLEQCFRHYFNYIGVLLNANCGTVEQILYTASINRWFDFKHVWLIIDETEHKNLYRNHSFNSEFSENSIILDTLSNLNISVDTDIILAARQEDQFKLSDVYNFGKVQGGNLITAEMGVWKTNELNEGLLRILNACKYHRRYDFQQIGLRMISVVTSERFDPSMLTNVRPVRGVATITRTSTIILHQLAHEHNFKFIYTRTDKWLGSYESNSSRAVATGLYFEEQDISSVFRYLDILFGRVTLIHPSLTTLETRYFYRIPTTGPGKFENQFLRPLSAGTWFSLLAVSTICTVIMVVAARLESRPTSFQFGFFSVAAIVCQQYFEDDTYDMAIKRISAARKLVTFVIGMSAVLVYNFYTSSVVSWLLNGPPPSITSLEELQQSSLELIFEDVGYTHSWLTVPNYYFNIRNAKIEDVIRHRVLTRQRRVPLYMALEEGIAMVKAGGYAYLTEPFNANQLISATFDKSELCELGSLSSIAKVNLYPGVQLNSPYKEFLTWRYRWIDQVEEDLRNLQVTQCQERAQDRKQWRFLVSEARIRFGSTRQPSYLTRFLEKGIISCIQRRTSPPPVSCEGSSPRALALGGAAPAFILLAGGSMLAVGIMLLERFIYKMKQKKQFN